MDFTRHNEEVEQVWAAYRAGTPIRVPVQITSVPRIWILDPSLNETGITWREYLNNPDVMLDICLRHLYHVVHHIPQDSRMGIPDDMWNVHLEFGNVYEEAWFGCDVIYPEGQIAATVPRYTGPEGASQLLDRGMPGPFDGFMGKIKADTEYLREKAAGMEFHGRPVNINHPIPLGTDGPLTVANGLRGSEIFEDMLTDETGYHAIMSQITDAIIIRILAWRSYLGLEKRPAQGWFADDAVQFLSPRSYREKVLPYHRRLLDGLFGEGPHNVHLCGNVQRLMPIFVQELNVHGFDTGFPINFSTLRDEVGEDVEISGGVPVSLLVEGTPAQVYSRAQDILTSGIMKGGKFIFKEANDLAPCVPLDNLAAMYSAAHDFGTYPHT